MCDEIAFDAGRLPDHARRRRFKAIRSIRPGGDVAHPRRRRPGRSPCCDRNSTGRLRRWRSPRNSHFGLAPQKPAQQHIRQRFVERVFAQTRLLLQFIDRAPQPRQGGKHLPLRER